MTDELREDGPPSATDIACVRSSCASYWQAQRVASAAESWARLENLRGHAPFIRDVLNFYIDEVLPSDDANMRPAIAARDALVAIFRLIPECPTHAR